MLRWYLKIVLVLFAGFSVLIVAVSRIGGSANSYELAYIQCISTRRYCDQAIMDAERGVSAMRPIIGLPYFVEWSPQGTRLAITHLTDIDAAQMTIVNSASPAMRLPTLGIVSAWLSEDRLLYQRPDEQFVIYDFSTQSVEPFPLHALNSYHSFFFVKISPDARYIAVNAMDDTEDVLFIQPVDAAGLTLRLNGSIAEQNISWSSNNQSVLYSVTDGTSNLDIYTIRLITGDTVALAASPDSEYLARWSHHNQRLAYISTDSLFRHQLVIRVADGTAHTFDLSAAFADPIGNIYQLEWSPDDRYLLLQLAVVGGGLEFYLVATDGSSSVRRLTYAGNATFAAWRP